MQQETRWGRIATVTAGHFFVDFYATVLPPVLPFVAREFGLSMSMTGVLVTVVSIFSSWSQPVFGYLLDGYRRFWPLPVAVMWVAILASSLGLAGSYWALAAIVSLAGVGSAVYHPLGSVAVAANSGRRKGTAMSMYITGGTIGATLPPLLAVPLVAAYGLKALLVLAPPGIIVSLLMVLLGVHRAPAAGESSGSRELPRLRDMARLLHLSLALGLRLGATWSYNTFMVMYFLHLGYSEIYGGRVLSAYILAGSLGVLLGGIASDRTDRRRYLMATCVLGGLCLLGSFYVGGLLVPLLLILGNAFISSSTPIGVVIGQSLVPSNATMASGVMLGMSFGIAGLGSALTGVLADIMGLPRALEVNLLLLVVSLALTYFLPSEASSDVPASGKAVGEN